LSHTYFEVLGKPDLLVAQSGGILGELALDWRATAQPERFRKTTAGPSSYEVGASSSDVITAHDAVRMLWFALDNDLPWMRAATGMEALFY
jgi:hypothetical protein